MGLPLVLPKWAVKFIDRFDNYGKKPGGEKLSGAIALKVLGG